MASIVVSGDTSGTVTLQAPAVAGTTTLTLPSTSGTILTTASGQWITSGSDIYYNTGNVGIGTSSPATKLDINNGSLQVKSADNTGTNAVIKAISNNGTASTWLTFNGVSVSSGNACVFYNGTTENMRINSSGNVGIGTSSPSTKLNIAASGTGVALQFNGYIDAQNIQAKIECERPNFNNFEAEMRFYTHNGTSLAQQMVLSQNGELRVGNTDNGAYNLQCNGTAVWGAGAYVNGSDERIKNDIAPISSGLDVVAKLNPVTYKYKENWSQDQSTQTGFIAQELLTALDGQVYVDGVVQQGGAEGYYSVAYQNIIPILTKAIQELNAKVEAQAAEIAALKESK
jgi:hypothetical protein